MSDEADNDDEQLLAPTELATRIGGSKAIVQYAIDAGCPTIDGKLSNATFIRWMLDNYGKFRLLAGLPALPPHEDHNPREEGRKKIANMLITMTDFMSSRATDPDTKKATAEVSKFLRQRSVE